MKQSKVADYYDDFSSTFLRDYFQGNHRVNLQHDFFRRAISPKARRIAVIGSGSGEGAWHVVTKCAKNAQLVAADISPRCVELGRCLFGHPRIEYVEADMTVAPLSGKFDTILIPDVYEHIPIALRSAFHEKVKEMLDDNGRILVTAPTPAHQKLLRHKGEGLQIVDEDISLGDLLKFADDVGGNLSFYSLISICGSCNNYFHAAIEKGAPQVRVAGYNDVVTIRTVIKECGCPRFVINLADRIRKLFVSYRIIKAMGFRKWRQIVKIR